MSYMQVKGMIADNLGTTPIAGLDYGMGYGANMGYLSPMKTYKFKNSGDLITPIGMPIATSFGMGPTIMTNPLSGMPPSYSNTSSLSPSPWTNPFNALSAMYSGTSMGLMPSYSTQTNTTMTYNRKGVNVTITGCQGDVDKVITCLDDHLGGAVPDSLQATLAKVVGLTPAPAPAAAAPAAAAPAAAAPAAAAPVGDLIRLS